MQRQVARIPRCYVLHIDTLAWAKQRKTPAENEGSGALVYRRLRARLQVAA